MVSSFLQDIPRHDTHLFEVREAFKRTLLLGFRAYSSAYYIAKNLVSGGSPGGGLRGACAPAARNTPCVAYYVPATDAGPLINDLVHTLLVLVLIADDRR